ncbi:MAG: glycoside hydrolase family 28 protein, partial [Paludibacteraceae bacterium]|nr:glycoside hydrolase family 28 protein [Paludibacteraceae bacterium]
MTKTRTILLSAALILSVTGLSAKKNKACDYQLINNQTIASYYDGVPFDMARLKAPVFPNRVVSIVDYGAKGDGLNLCTQAIQQAIDETSGKGGGTVVIPAGIWATGPIVLKDNIRLHAASGALIQFSADFSLYPIIDASFEGVDTKRCQSPISAYGAKNIAITGSGVFNGAGDAWRPLKKAKVTASQWKQKVASGGVVTADGKVWYPTEGAMKAQAMCVDQNVPEGLQTGAEWEEIHAFLRPVMVNLVKCEGVLLEGVTFENSPAWNLHPLMSNGVILYRLNVRNPWYAQNGDGVDLESCKNSIIAECSFDVGDDAICMKSGKNEDGRRRAVPTENVIVSRCTVYHGHGGFVVGSEMSGDIRNILVDNCLFIGTDVGLRFKSTRGRGGIVENIHISNVNMTNIATDPLLFDLFYGGKGAGEETDDEIAARVNAPIPPVTIETPQFQNI